MATDTKTFYPGAYDSSSSVTITNASNSVGKGSNNASYATIKPTRLGTSGNVYWPFDTSAIPDDAEIVSVSCKAKANVSSISAITTATLQLYSGNTAKGSAVSFKDSSASAKAITAGTWTKSELASARLRLVLMGSTSASFYFYGADLTVTYTYQSEKFMLKLSGDYEDVARTFKRVSGIWVEQTDLANVIEDGVRYKNGGEIASVLPSGYTRLDYIESSGSQYINTGYKATSENYRIKCKFATVNDETSTVLFGGGASTDIISALLQSTNQVKFYVGSGSVSDATATFVRGAECELECHANTGTFTVNLDGVAYSGSYSGAVNKDYPLFIFANNVSGTATQFSSIRLYAFQIYDNGNMVRNLIPCVNANSVAGMYDTVNDVFYPSASGTAFIAPESNNIINFTIGGTSYQAEEGMTWEQWAESSYNTAGFYIWSAYVADDYDRRVSTSEGLYVAATDIVQSGYAYILQR